MLVCEGPTDFHIIEKIAEQLSQDFGYKINIIMLSPQVCASGSYERQGWGGVKSWCVKFGNKNDADLANLNPAVSAYVRRQNWRALLAFNGADGIIIQMDTDIAEYLKDVCDFDAAAGVRKAHCAEALQYWLNERPNEKLYFSLATYSLETWLLATYAPTHDVFNDLSKPFDYEELSDHEQRLISLGWKSTNKKGRRRLKKSPSTTYVPYGELVAENLAVVRSRCSEADNLCQYLTT